MNSWMVSLLVFVAAPAFAQGTRISCDHQLMGAPFATIAFDLFADGSTSIAATITQYGRSHEELIAPGPRAEGEMLHLWISKDTSNELQMIIYERDQPQGRAKLINENIPVGKEMWGTCKFDPIP